MASVVASAMLVGSPVSRVIGNFFLGCAFHLGDHNISAGIRDFDSNEAYLEMVSDVYGKFIKADYPGVILALNAYFRGETYSLRDLFKDDQIWITDEILQAKVEEVSEQADRIYESTYPLMRYFGDMDIPLLPNESPDQYKDLGKRFPGGDRYPGFTGFLAARMAAYYAYGMAGIVDPNEDLDLVELHDAFTISDIQTYEDIGIRPYGEGRTYVESGECYHTNPLTGKPGKLPANLSGGLIGNMHAVGATGIMQVVEVAQHIWGRWAEMHADEAKWKRFNRVKPDDWINLQVVGAKRGLAISHAGVGSHVTATVLMHPDHQLERRA